MFTATQLRFTTTHLVSDAVMPQPWRPSVQPSSSAAVAGQLPVYWLEMPGRREATLTVLPLAGVDVSSASIINTEHCISLLDRYGAFLKRVTTSSALKTHRLCERGVRTAVSSRLLCVIWHYS